MTKLKSIIPVRKYIIMTKITSMTDYQGRGEGGHLARATDIRGTR